MANARPRTERVFYSSAFLPLEERFCRMASYRLLCSDSQWARIRAKQQRLEDEGLRTDRYGSLWQFERKVLENYYGRTCTGSPKRKFVAPTPRVLHLQALEMRAACGRPREDDAPTGEAAAAVIAAQFYPTPERLAKRIWPHRPEFAHRHAPKSPQVQRAEIVLGFEVHPDLVMGTTLREQYNRLVAIHSERWDAHTVGKQALLFKKASRPQVPAYPDPLTDLDAKGYCEYWFTTAAFAAPHRSANPKPDQPKDYRIRCSPVRRALIHSRQCLLMAFSQHPDEPLFKNMRSILRNFDRDVIRQYGVEKVPEDW